MGRSYEARFFFEAIFRFVYASRDDIRTREMYNIGIYSSLDTIVKIRLLLVEITRANTELV